MPENRNLSSVPYNVLSSTAFQQWNTPIFAKKAELSDYMQAIQNLKKGLKDGTASKEIADIILKIHNNDFNYQTVIMLALDVASMAVPELGILTPFVGLFFSMLNPRHGGEPTINIQDIFKAIQPAIQQMIGEALTKDQIANMDTQAKALQNQLSAYQDAMYIYSNIKNPTNTDITDLHIAIDSTLTQLNNNLAFFQKAGYQRLGLPYYSLFATLHLILLSDKIKHGIKWGYNPTSIPDFQKQFNYFLREHSEYLVTTAKGTYNLYNYMWNDIHLLFENIFAYMTLWSTFSPADYPLEMDLDRTQSFTRSLNYGVNGDMVAFEIGTAFFFNGCYENYPHYANLHTKNHRGETAKWTKSFLSITSSCFDTLDLPLDDPIISIYNSLFYNSSIQFNFLSGHTAVFPTGASVNTSENNLLQAYDGYKISTVHDCPNTLDASFTQVPIDAHPENVIGQNDPDNDNKIPIKGIPAEKYLQKNGWKNTREVANGAMAMVSKIQGDFLKFQIINSNSGQYKIRFHVATDSDGAALSFNGFDINKTFNLPNTKAIHTGGTRGFADQAAVYGLNGYYMLVDGPTVKVNSGVQEFTITNSGNQSVVLDRIEFVPAICDGNGGNDGPIITPPDFTIPNDDDVIGGTDDTIWKDGTKSAVRFDCTLYPADDTSINGTVFINYSNGDVTSVDTGDISSNGYPVSYTAPSGKPFHAVEAYVYYIGEKRHNLFQSWDDDDMSPTAKKIKITLQN